MPPDYVYVGRPTKWGNKVRIGNGMTPEEAVTIFRNWLGFNSGEIPRRSMPTCAVRAKPGLLVSAGPVLPCRRAVGNWLTATTRRSVLWARSVHDHTPTRSSPSRAAASSSPCPHHFPNAPMTRWSVPQRC